MTKLIKLSQQTSQKGSQQEQGQVLPKVIEDIWAWQETIDASAASHQHLLMSLEQCLDHPDEVARRAHKHSSDANPYKLGIALDNTTEVDQYSELIAAASLITIPFPSFTDGRGFSLARILRETLKFQGELRATGDILVDQLFYLYRCGFDAFSVADDINFQDVLAALTTFSVTYQGAADEPRPLFAR